MTEQLMGPQTDLPLQGNLGHHRCLQEVGSDWQGGMGHWWLGLPHHQKAPVVDDQALAVSLP